jgi:hypothetical protein
MKQPSDCGVHTVTKTGNLITTMVAGRRYVIDYKTLAHRLPG